MTSIISELKQWYNYHGLKYFAILSGIIIILLFISNIYNGSEGKYSWYRENNKNNSNFSYSFNKDDAFTSKLELKAKFILEDIFKTNFTKIRPDFLRNPVTGKNLEIDLYNDQLKLGVEIDGTQHKKYTPFFHRNKDHFYTQMYRDEIKKMQCAKHGITLINIDYDVGDKNLRSELVKQLRLHGFLV